MIENLFNGNEMKLDEILEIAKNLAEKNDNSAKQFNFGDGSDMDRYTKIVRGVARKYAVENFGVEREDLEQDLWLKVCELTNGGTTFPSEKLVAKCLWNVAVDKYRYHRRRRDSKAEYIEGTEDDSDSVSNKAEEIRLNSGKCFKSPMDAIIINETIDLFPKGSRERQYVITKLYMNGEIDPETYYGNSEDLVLPEDDSEGAVMKAIGYQSTRPGSWISRKNKIRETIYRYLGKIDESDLDSEENKLKAIKSRALEIFKESSSYYIYTSKICKDKSMKLLGCTEDRLIEIFKEDKSKLIVGVGHESKKFYLMKNTPKYVAIATEEGDRLYN